MKIYILFFLSFLFSPKTFGQLIPNLGGQRSGISAFQFLKIGVDARSSAMSDATISISNDASSLFSNPGAMSNVKDIEAIFSHTKWFAEIQYDFVGILYPISDANFIGVSLISLRTDEMEQTTETNQHTGRYFQFSDLAIATSYSQKLTDQFSAGVTLKFVNESLDKLSIKSFLFDIGTFYYTGIGSSRFAVVVTNFGENVSPNGKIKTIDGREISEFQSFSPPTIFKIGFAFEPYEDELNRVTTSLQLNHPNDNAENIRFGIEYEFNKMFLLRSGVKRTFGQKLFGKDETNFETFSFGSGVAIPMDFANVNFDYSFSGFGQLGNAHRITMILKM